MKIIMIIASILFLGLIHYASASPEITIYPIKTDHGFQNDGWHNTYTFGLDTHNQTINITSIYFKLNNTDVTLFNIGDSNEQILGFEKKSLSGLQQYIDAYTQQYRVIYDKEPLTVNTENQTNNKLKLDLIAPFSIDDSLGVQIQINYEIIKTHDNQTITSDWMAIGMLSNNDLTENTHVCTVGYGDCTYTINEKTTSQESTNTLKAIQQQNSILILEQTQTNKLLAYNYCIYRIENNLEPWSKDNLEKCVSQILNETSK